MRKRSKYRPKGVRLNTISYVVESMTPVANCGGVLVDMQVKNHSALTELTQGRATKDDISVLIAAVNMTEALCRLGFGQEYNDIIRDGLTALRAVGGRGLTSGRYILKAAEMQAMNEVMQLHDAQLEVITIKDMELALANVQEEIRNKRATPIKEIT